MSDLNQRLGQQWQCKASITIHAGRAVVGEIGSSDPAAMMAIGEAMDTAIELRRLAAEHEKPFVISERVYAAAGLDPGDQQKVSLRPPGAATPISATVAATTPALPPSWTAPRERRQRRAALRRLWSG